MRIATWNVNSIAARTERLVTWLERNQPDVLCLQELKVTDDRFPHIEVRALGYEVALFGQAAYNGVAILARQPITDVRRGLDPGLEGADSRLISGLVSGPEGPMRVISVYVPNGQIVGSDKFAYKLAWLARLRTYLEEHHRPDERLVVCGDFNCALDARDVGKPELHQGDVLVHEDVRAAVRRFMDWGLVDTFRAQHAEGGHFSWWDYRMLGFPRGNGLRIDYVFATEPLAAELGGARIDRNERKGKKPSDHVPVLAAFGEGDPVGKGGDPPPDGA